MTSSSPHQKKTPAVPDALAGQTVQEIKQFFPQMRVRLLEGKVGRGELLQEDLVVISKSRLIEESLNGEHHAALISAAISLNLCTKTQSKRHALFIAYVEWAILRDIHHPCTIFNM